MIRGVTMASITIKLAKTDHVTIEHDEGGGYTITHPRAEGADMDDAICIHNGPLVQIMEDDGLTIVVEL
jgi:hypothetical protein